MTAPVHAEIDAEDRPLSPLQRDQPGQEAEEGGLPGSVAPREQHGLPRRDVEIDAGEGREPAEEADRGAETNDEGHFASEVGRAS